MSAYAVIHTGGKQYRVAPGDVIRVEKLDAETGSSIQIDQVYLVSADGQVRTGNPFLADARVVAQVLDQGRGDKIIVFKKRRRKGYYKTTGHRQYLTSLRIAEIVLGGASYKAEEVKKAQPKAAPAPVHDVAKAREKERKKSSKTPAAEPKQSAPAEPVVRKPEAPIPPITKEPEQAPSATRAAASQTSPAVDAKKHPDEALQSPEAVPAKTVKTPSAKPQERAAPVLEQPKPAMPDSLSGSPEPSAAPSGIVTTRPMAERREEPAPEQRKRWGLYAAVAGALALLVLLLLLLLGGPRQAPQPAKQAETPAGRTTPDAGRGGEQPKTKKPPVQDRKIRETAPVQKPVAPVQPPD